MKWLGVCSLTRAYHLFRAMGLRHLFVIPTEPKVVGLLTRKDVIKENAKLVLGEKANAGLFGPSGGGNQSIWWISKSHGPCLDILKPQGLPFLPYDALAKKGTAPEWDRNMLDDGSTLPERRSLLYALDERSQSLRLRESYKEDDYGAPL